MPCRLRLPKGLDLQNPGPPPDPDRWLPKWQRSDFTKKKRNRQQRREKVGPPRLSRRMVRHGVRFPNYQMWGEGSSQGTLPAWPCDCRRSCGAARALAVWMSLWIRAIFLPLQQGPQRGPRCPPGQQEQRPRRARGGDNGLRHHESALL